MGQNSKNKEIILNFAIKKFMTEGFLKTTMDELAKDLRISKKTIYLHFPSKEKLIEASFKNIMQHVKLNVSRIADGPDNSVIKLKLISNFLVEFILRASQKWINDLKTHGGVHWQNIEANRYQIIYENFSKIVDQGKSEGLITDRPNIILLTVLMSAIQGVVNPEFLINNNFSASHAAEITLDIIFSGVLSKKGRKIYKQFKTGVYNEENNFA